MSESKKTKSQLMAEVEALRVRVAMLEQAETNVTQRNRKLMALHSISITIASSLNHQHVLDTAAREMANLVGVEACALSEWNQEIDTISLVAEYAPDDWWNEGLVQEVFSLADYPLTKQVLVNHRVAQITASQPDIDQAESSFLQEANIKSLLMVPLIFQNQAVGLVELMDGSTERVFTDEEVALAQLLANQAASAIVNAQIFSETRQHLTELTILNEISQAITSTLDLQDIWTTITKHSARLLDTTGTLVALFDESSKEVRITAAFGQGLSYGQGQRLTPGLGVVGWVIEHGETILVPDISQEPHFATNFDQGENFTGRSVLCVPLWAKGQVIGAIEVVNTKKDAFKERDVQLLSALAAMASAAIENARLYEAEQVSRKEAEALHRSALILTSTIDPDKVIDRILAELKQVVSYDSASVQLLKGDHLEIIGGHGFPNFSDIMGLSFNITDGAIYPLDYKAIHTKKPVVIDDTHINYKEHFEGPHASANIRSWLGVPMLIGGQVIGLITIDKQQPHFFTEAHAHRASAYAAQAAVAIENARLYQEAQQEIADRRRAEELLQYRLELDELIAAISTSFINVPSEEIDNGINQALRILGEFAEIDRSYVFLLSEDGTKMTNTHEWCAHGIEPQFYNLQGLPVAFLPWWMQMLQRCETIHIPRVADLPNEASSEKEILQAQDIQSLIALPMTYAGSLVGFLGFDSVRSEKRWSEDIIALLKMVGEIFVNALERQGAETRLKTYQEHLETLVQERTVKLEQAMADLQEVDQLKSEFLTTAAHELRTPLTSILGFSEILLMRQLDETRQQKYSTLINEQASHLTKIVRNLLDVSRLESGQGLKLELEPVEMIQLMKKVVVSLSNEVTGYNIQIEALVTLPFILGDPFRLAQVGRNLLSNAMKYSPPGSSITIRSRVIPGYLEISLQDEGSGLTQEQQAHLFKPFYRADASNTAIGGAGLGLATSKLIIEHHGGQIWLESKKGRGTTVYFTLPLIENSNKG